MSEGMEFHFRQISSALGETNILKNINGIVKPGEILAVTGHKGAGKSCLLAILGGHGTKSEGEFFTIHSDLSETVAMDTAYVSDEDFFYPTLTLGETLKYAAMLRLHGNISYKKKLQRVKEIEAFLGLDTFSNLMTQFAAPSDKRKLSIACELTLNAPVTIIDEPFKGMSVREALNLMTSLKHLATTTSKALILGVGGEHSNLVTHCNRMLFLHEGQVIFDGDPDRLSGFLQTAGYVCPQYQNPTDFLLELLVDERSSQSTSDRLRTSSEGLRVDETGLEQDGEVEPDRNGIQLVETCFDACSRARGTKRADDKTDQAIVELESHNLIVHKDSKNVVHHADQGQIQGHKGSFWQQLLLLTVRNFHTARRRILFPISLVQNLYILVLCVLIWWRPERREERIMDRMGLFFFTTVQWAFFSLLDAILTFPKEIKVIRSERSRKLYNVSAYCIAKTISEFPLVIIQPCVYLLVIYWVANLNGAAAFVSSLVVLVADVFAAQSIGLFVGVALNPPWTVSVVSLGLLSMMLWGGAFNKPPSWLAWGKFASYFTYGLNALITVEFQHAAPIKCGEKSMVPICNIVDPVTNKTATHFPSNIVLLMQGLTWSVWDNVLVLVVIMVAMRLLWYFTLRMKG